MTCAGGIQQPISWENPPFTRMRSRSATSLGSSAAFAAWRAARFASAATAAAARFSAAATRFASSARSRSASTSPGGFSVRSLAPLPSVSISTPRANLRPALCCTTALSRAWTYRPVMRQKSLSGRNLDRTMCGSYSFKLSASFIFASAAANFLPLTYGRTTSGLHAMT